MTTDYKGSAYFLRRLNDLYKFVNSEVGEGVWSYIQIWVF
jgi:hypothetical protein